MKTKDLIIRFSKTVNDSKITYNLKNCVRLAIKMTLEHESFPYNANVSVTFCDNLYIKSLNSQHRNIDKVTDVLSFPMYDNGEFPEAECRFEACLGDIVISLERVREQAMEFGNSFIRECIFLTVHSVLHLLGYDHERGADDDEIQCEKQRQIMRKIEEKVNLDD